MRAAMASVGIDPVTNTVPDQDFTFHVDEETGDGNSWIPVDLGAVLDGTFERVQASIGHRSDGVPLLYPGKEHSVFGEPEAGKGWLLLHVAADELARGGRVLYIDFEDDEGTVVGRLHRELGVPADDIKARFFYVRPDGPGVQHYGKLLESTDPNLVMLDGVTEGYGLHGWQIKENDDSPKWRTAFVKPAMRRGAATLSTDHVVKNKDARNGYAIGGQHKKAGLTGVLFELINVSPFGKGMCGRSKLIIHKDRNGDLRQHGVPDENNPRVTHFADLHLEARDMTFNPDAAGSLLDVVLSLTLTPPLPRAGGGIQDAYDEMAALIARSLEKRGGHYDSRDELEGFLRADGVKFDAGNVTGALQRLVDRGRLKITKVGRSKSGDLIPPPKEMGTCERSIYAQNR